MAASATRKFRTSTHCVRRVFVCRNEFVGICGDSHTSNHEKKGRSGKETRNLLPFCLVNANACKNRNRIDEDHYCEIICNLNMVCLDLHAEGECEEGSAKNGLRKPFFPRFSLCKGCLVCIYHSCKDPWKIGDCLHFGVMTHLDDLHVV